MNVKNIDATSLYGDMAMGGDLISRRMSKKSV